MVYTKYGLELAILFNGKKYQFEKLTELMAITLKTKQKPDISLLQYKMAYRFFIPAFYFEHST